MRKHLTADHSVIITIITTVTVTTIITITTTTIPMMMQAMRLYGCICYFFRLSAFVFVSVLVL